MNDLSEYADENAILVLVGNQIDKPDQYETRIFAENIMKIIEEKYHMKMERTL